MVGPATDGRYSAAGGVCRGTSAVAADGGRACQFGRIADPERHRGVHGRLWTSSRSTAATTLVVIVVLVTVLLGLPVGSVLVLFLAPRVGRLRDGLLLVTFVPWVTLSMPQAFGLVP
jgi:hypothetical protein